MSRYQDGGAQPTPGTRGPRPGRREGSPAWSAAWTAAATSCAVSAFIRIDDDVPAQQHAADDLPGVRERAGRVDGGGGGTGGSRLGHNPDCRRNGPGPAARHAGHGNENLIRITEVREGSYFRNTEVRPILLSIAARDIRQPADSK